MCQHRTHGAGQSQHCHCSVRVVVRHQGTPALCRPSQNTHVTLSSASGPVPSGLHTRLWHQQTACPFCLQSSGWSPCLPADTDLGNPWLRRTHSGGNTKRQRRNQPTSTDVPEPGRAWSRPFRRRSAGAVPGGRGHCLGNIQRMLPGGCGIGPQPGRPTGLWKTRASGGRVGEHSAR